MAKGQTDFVKPYERHRYKNVALSEFNIYDPNLKKYCKYRVYIPLFSTSNLALYTFIISTYYM
jgi:hypothetical protein